MSQLSYTMFDRVLFPDLDKKASVEQEETLLLQRVIRYLPLKTQPLDTLSFVVFDFETTGLDSRDDRIIEIGAVKWVNFEAVARFCSLVKPDIELPPAVSQISGISKEMLENEPMIDQILPQFIEFFQGSILVAHHADFDMAFLRENANRLGFQLKWPAICTLKMARTFLPKLESKNLDTLAAHFGLQFESRHRSMGDVKVTSTILKEFILNHQDKLKVWQDLENFYV